jgi:hypothetical protein
LTLGRGVALGALGVMVAFGVWLGVGLLQAREDLGVAGAGLRTELVRAHAALGRGDPAGAQTAIRAASRDLDAAEAVTARRPMRVAARLPVLGRSVSDLEHLLAAARNLTTAADRAVAVSVHLRSGRFAVLHDGRFDLGALDHAAAQAKGLVAELAQVRAELAQVRGDRVGLAQLADPRVFLARFLPASNSHRLLRADRVDPGRRGSPGSSAGALRPRAEADGRRALAASGAPLPRCAASPA